ncbi:MAG: hypothetical protein JO250_12345, partial [Armatimonadetes bacterium]|nr:hypothetical protein [Armatimonadota bacterium]
MFREIVSRSPVHPAAGPAGGLPQTDSGLGARQQPRQVDQPHGRRRDQR